jgi:predicted MFS family arabinose efflux permease
MCENKKQKSLVEARESLLEAGQPNQRSTVPLSYIGPLFFTTFLSSALYAIVFPSMALLLIDKFHTSTSFVGLSVSAYSLCKALVAPVIGHYAAKQLRSPLLFTVLFLIAGSALYGKQAHVRLYVCG